MQDVFQTIVIAWTEVVQVPDGKPYARDLGALPGLKEETVPHAVVWLLRGRQADVQKAQAHVSSEYPDTGRVFTYPTDEKDPIGQAKKGIAKWAKLKGKR